MRLPDLLSKLRVGLEIVKELKAPKVPSAATEAAVIYVSASLALGASRVNQELASIGIGTTSRLPDTQT